MSSALALALAVAVAVPEEEEEEEEGRLIKVVEYVESSMCEELLCKFPDTSAFDFDYSQSSIWSPLVPRPQKSLAWDWDLGTPPPKLSYRLGLDKTTLKKVAANLKNNIFTMFKKKQKKRRRSFIKPPDHFSPTPPSTKGWSKVLKAASKHFKKKKKKDPTLHVKLSKYSRQSDS
ncbi:uncharacterized protein LOC117911496 [Vitis riparia]|uniref:uncharacterized protein LOC117911496 n=1 Tax=Vitis riparia TaxID=96939 RepID=UPI00155ACADF|nr:uncharacterized protein LOC117911496 [Vitis riparia]